MILAYLELDVFPDKSQLTSYAAQASAGPYEVAGMPKIFQGYSGTHEGAETWHFRIWTPYVHQTTGVNQLEMCDEDERKAIGESDLCFKSLKGESRPGGQNLSQALTIPNSTSPLGFVSKAVNFSDERDSAEEVKRVATAKSDNNTVWEVPADLERRSKGTPNYLIEILEALRTDIGEEKFKDHVSFIDAAAVFVDETSVDQTRDMLAPFLCKMLYIFNHYNPEKQFIAYYDLDARKVLKYEDMFANTSLVDKGSKNSSSKIEFWTGDKKLTLDTRGRSKLESVCGTISSKRNAISVTGSGALPVVKAAYNLDATINDLGKLETALVTWYDQPHVVGSDFPNKRDGKAKAIITAGEKVKRDLEAQAIMRIF